MSETITEAIDELIDAADSVRYTEGDATAQKRLKTARTTLERLITNGGRPPTKRPPYTCADCGRGFFDLAGPAPPLVREDLSVKGRFRTTKEGDLHEITTIVARITPALLGTFWMPNFPESTRTVHLCRDCGAKRGYIEGDSPQRGERHEAAGESEVTSPAP